MTYNLYTTYCPGCPRSSIFLLKMHAMRITRETIAWNDLIDSWYIRCQIFSRHGVTQTGMIWHILLDWMYFDAIMEGAEQIIERVLARFSWYSTTDTTLPVSPHDSIGCVSLQAYRVNLNGAAIE